MSAVFSINTELDEARLENLVEFLYSNYLLAYPQRFTNVTKSKVDGISSLSYTAIYPDVFYGTYWYVDISITAVKPIQVKISSKVFVISPEVVEGIKLELSNQIREFERLVREAVLYFAWVQGKELIAERLRPPKKTVQGMVSDTMVMLSVFFMAISLMLFSLFGMYAPILVVAIQSIVILISDKILIKVGDWLITPQTPFVSIIRCQLPIGEYIRLKQVFSEEHAMKIKQDIQGRVFNQHIELSPQLASDALKDAGVVCPPENISVKVIDVYKLVAETSNKHGLPTPKIAVSNTLLPNAAASGLGPSHGVVIITTGLLSLLKEDEIMGVMGHELSHLKNHDPMALFIIGSAEYLLRVYVFWPILLIFPYFYYIFAMSIIYFIAKFFEARADLESAIVTRNPQALASALRKIGLRRPREVLGFGEWLNWEPHPPIRFRIARLEQLKTTDIKHPFLRSVKDVIEGFLNSLR